MTDDRLHRRAEASGTTVQRRVGLPRTEAESTDAEVAPARSPVEERRVPDRAGSRPREARSGGALRSRSAVASGTGRRPRRRPAPRWVIARVFEADLSAPVLAAANRISNPRQISERIAMGRALWRELVLGFASQLAELRLSFSQLAALYILADGRTRTIADLAETLGRSPSATSRLVAGLVRRRLTERRVEEADRRQRTVALTQRGRALLRTVDRARAEQFLRAVRTLPPAERALIAMGVAALATHAISPQGRLVRHPVE